MFSDLFDLGECVVSENIGVFVGDFHGHGHDVGATKGLFHPVVILDVFVLGGQKVSEARIDLNLRNVQREQNGRHADNEKRDPLAIHQPIGDGLAACFSHVRYAPAVHSIAPPHCDLSIGTRCIGAPLSASEFAIVVVKGKHYLRLIGGIPGVLLRACNVNERLGCRFRSNIVGPLTLGERERRTCSPSWRSETTKQSRTPQTIACFATHAATARVIVRFPYRPQAARG